MSSQWYLMDANTTGGFENAEFDLWHEAFENDTLQSFAKTTVLDYGDRPTNTPREFFGVFQSETEDSYNQMKIRQLICSIGNIRCGELLMIKDRWYIVMSLVDNNKVYEKAVLYYCNFMLNFTSPVTRSTVSYPAYVHNATQYNSGERARDNMVIVSSQNLVYLPFNEETCLIDNDYRFLIDRNTEYPSAWKVAQVDTTNDFWDGVGIVKIMVVEDEHASTDDNKNMVADNTKWLDKRFPTIVPPIAGGGWID